MLWSPEFISSPGRYQFNKKYSIEFSGHFETYQYDEHLHQDIWMSSITFWTSETEIEDIKASP